MTDIVIDIKNITKRFGPVTALENVSFSIPRHSIFGVLGPNGAGKTTLFSVIAGFIRPEEGSVTVLEESRMDHLLGRVGILPQDALFQANIPIIDQLTYFLRLTGWSLEDAREEVVRVLRIVGLDAILLREASTLSHGMYKRLALAQAFLGSPEIIILDEPTAGLDWRSAKTVRKTIKKLQENVTIVVSSHNMSEMQELCDHVAVLERGSLVAVGPVDEVTGTSQSITIVLNRDLSPELTDESISRPGIKDMSQVEEHTYRVFFEPGLSPEEVDRTMHGFQKFIIEKGITLRSFQEDNRIEDLYLKVTEKEGDHP